MVIQTELLDPNAQSYTDNEIVDKVNTATNFVTRTDAVTGAALDADLDDIDEGTANKHLTSAKDTKLTGIEDNATADQTGDEMVTAINAGTGAITREGALSQDDLMLVKTNPVTGEFQVKNIHRTSAGKYEIEYDDTPEP